MVIMVEMNMKENINRKNRYGLNGEKLIKYHDN